MQSNPVTVAVVEAAESVVINNIGSLAVVSNYHESQAPKLLADRQAVIN